MRKNQEHNMHFYSGEDLKVGDQIHCVSISRVINWSWKEDMSLVEVLWGINQDVTLNQEIGNWTNQAILDLLFMVLASNH